MIYVYRCSKCNTTTEVYKPLRELDKKEVCTCGTEMHRVLAPPTTHVWKPDWWEHIGPEPIYIESKEQLFKECKKHGCYAPGYMSVGPSEHITKTKR